jgi:hypothetical protein
MSRNGTGTYNLPAGNPVSTGTTISSSWANSTLTDIGSALTGSIASDGQTIPTANLPMGNYAHTNVGNATARTMYASASQAQDSTLTYLTSVSGTNAITASAPISMTAYATGQVFHFIASGTSTGAVTININAIGIKSIVRVNGSPLLTGDIPLGSAVQIMYDGTNFQLLGLSVAADVNAGLTSLTTINATTTYTTSGITLPSQTAFVGSVWRIRAYGQYLSVNSATARNAQIACFWGSTQLTALTVAVGTSLAQTSGFLLEFELTATSTTDIWTTGQTINRIGSSTTNNNNIAMVTAASTTVTAGAQTIDLRFSMSNASMADEWRVSQVTMERLK